MRPCGGVQNAVWLVPAAALAGLAEILWKPIRQSISFCWAPINRERRIGTPSPYRYSAAASDSELILDFWLNAKIEGFRFARLKLCNK
jgi:hypothetical protein